MADRSTQVGYRLRIQPPDLSTYPDAAKLVWFGFVVKYGLVAKDKDLARGLGADGNPLKPLRPKSIKYRKSEVGPTFKHAPPLEPSYARSRVRSLLTGRPHTSSAEFWWRFDSHTGRSFAEVLRYQRDEYGRDVFGLSPRGTAWTLAQATKEWERWKREAGYARLPVTVPAHAGTVGSARPVRKAEVLRPVRKIEVKGRVDLENFDLMGGEALVKRAISAGTFTGFRRLNARGERWKPGRGL